MNRIPPSMRALRPSLAVAARKSRFNCTTSIEASRGEAPSRMAVEYMTVSIIIINYMTSDGVGQVPMVTLLLPYESVPP